jgi:hypothetical protein
MQSLEYNLNTVLFFFSHLEKINGAFIPLREKLCRTEIEGVGRIKECS